MASTIGLKSSSLDVRGGVGSRGWGRADCKAARIVRRLT
ncbi:hypothetical protein BKA14_000836 [Actinoplanes abujensis]|uniref:Uncharacterized protein n=1 Tax=Paractinoplanes abujensis TaxID=882441 RepID=A0A7W7CLF9_9ACTN|nr:hypothetical protein [Actinoplanes abujensis]